MSNQITTLHNETLRGAKFIERDFMFKGVRLNGEAKGNGEVYVWFATSDEDIDNTFDAREHSEDEFMSEVAEWVIENR